MTLLLVGRIQRGVDPHACRARITFAADDSLGLQPKRLSINARVVPYSLRFYLYLFVAGVVVTVIAVCYGPMDYNIVFAFIAAYLTIVIGRWVLGKKNL